jgi:chromate transporter
MSSPNLTAPPPPAAPPSTSTAPAHGITFGEGMRTWAKVGMLSFGGPAGQIAVMHRILVDEKRWISEDRFLHALNYCMLLPGPEAQQLACYVGWLLHRTIGGIIAGAFFVVPGFVAILALSLAYVAYAGTAVVQALLYGLKPAIVAIVAAAVLRIGKRALKNRAMLALAAVAFVSMFVFAVPFPLVVGGAAVVGWIGGRLRPDLFVVIKGHGAAKTSARPVIADDALAHTAPSWGHALRTGAFWLILWWAPVLALLAALGPHNLFTREGLFFSEAAVVTFGGAYAVLAFLAQQAVQVFHWVTPHEMMDGLGMAETTPGPLIMVTQFVGFMGAWRDPNGPNPYLAATLASMLVTWVTFMPSYLYIFLGAPWIEHLRGNQRLNATLSAITAAVVGVVLNLACWFALRTLFGEVADVQAGPLHLSVPTWSTIDWAALVLSAGACVAMLRYGVGMIWTLAVCLALGMAWSLTARP